MIISVETYSAKLVTPSSNTMPLEANDIAALAEALKNLQPVPQVNATAVKLPQFWPGNPEVWFKQIESVFSTRNPAITTQQTKFDYVIQALDNNSADKVQSIILNPPVAPYDKIKSALIAAFGKSQATKDQELLNLNGLGDRKPSELLQHMRNMNANPETLFKALFMSQLPHDARRILASSTKTELDELAVEADRIVEVTRLANESTVNATNWGAKNRVETSQRSRSSVETATGTWPTIPGLCRFHSRYGEMARRCVKPCKFETTPVSENGQSGRK